MIKVKPDTFDWEIWEIKLDEQRWRFSTWSSQIAFWFEARLKKRSDLPASCQFALIDFFYGSLPLFDSRSSMWRQEVVAWWPLEKCSAPSWPSWSGSPLCSLVSRCLCRRSLTSRWRPGLGRLFRRRRRRRKLRAQSKGGKGNAAAPGNRKWIKMIDVHLFFVVGCAFVWFCSNGANCPFGNQYCWIVIILNLLDQQV